ncbi:bifunctional glutamate--cysteine ligase GshA/glutathione synthetase GshB [Leptospira sarikeiensis]|uniref:Bifunctional glutamate--cysteine ligase GshA/glutathione synthetase GshB n=1 Tax=Leptospira sarikeiensis TaxID=2484943 RepID=A0A4R9K376_9LEPT|nr:bifunctional glutamate--cysteine ligase GshA/glutathione synthetase GshB [Leptospira sarikeiensis]TGL59606.1 bifunctional glutamate--cysteine ligase GshA/glutathione synthetase GshB [Leptospira sarikeiensis]
MKYKLGPGEKLDPNEFILKGFEDLEISTQIVIRDALNRGLEVEILDRPSHFIRLKGQGKTRLVKEASKTELDSYMTFLVMENKTVTKRILEESNILVPKGITVSDISSGLDFLKQTSDRKMVVKPVTTNFGIGISILQSSASEEDRKKALEIALGFSETAIIEEFAEGNEYRFLVIGDECVAVCNRIPANVLGDGKKTIRELVEEKNKDPRRGVGHVTPLEKIQLAETELSVLKEAGKSPDTVPSPGEVVFVRKNSNISTGGDSVDVTDIAHPSLKKLAVEAAKAAKAKICGVDIIVKDLKSEGDYRILELNFNPVLYIHNYPYSGKNRNVGEKILDVLGYVS